MEIARCEVGLWTVMHALLVIEAGNGLWSHLEEHAQPLFRYGILPFKRKIVPHTFPSPYIIFKARQTLKTFKQLHQGLIASTLQNVIPT